MSSLQRYIEKTQVRRSSAEAFCAQIAREVGCVYRPRCEVYRMLAVGEAWSAYGHTQVVSLLCLPMGADVEVVAALRETFWQRAAVRYQSETMQGSVLTPPIGLGQRGQCNVTAQLKPLLEVALARALHATPKGGIWALLEYQEDAVVLADAYFAAGFVLVALRPLHSLTPCYVFYKMRRGEEMTFVGQQIVVSAEDCAQLALLLGRGWVATKCISAPEGEAFLLVQTKR